MKKKYRFADLQPGDKVYVSIIFNNKETNYKETISSIKHVWGISGPCVQLYFENDIPILDRDNLVVLTKSVIYQTLGKDNYVIIRSCVNDCTNYLDSKIAGCLNSLT